MVSRWDCMMGSTVRETAAGEFVTYEDYATLEAENAKLRAAAPSAPAAQVHGWQMVPDMTADFSQFLTAVMDAAGLVRHGRQSKELSEYLRSQCMKYRLAAAPQPPVQDSCVRCGKETVCGKTHCEACCYEPISAPQPSDDVAKDAARYRWLKEQKQLSLRSCGGRWTREDGSKFVSSHRLAAGDTLFGPQETLDAAIDAAMTEVNK